MARYRDWELAEPAAAVPLFAKAVEAAGRNAFAQGRRPTLESATGKGPAKTIYEALASKLNQKPEALRAELGRYKAGKSVATFKKILKIGDALTELGWQLGRDDDGVQAGKLVAGCARTKARVEGEDVRESVEGRVDRMRCAVDRFIDTQLNAGREGDEPAAADFRLFVELAGELVAGRLQVILPSKAAAAELVSLSSYFEQLAERETSRIVDSAADLPDEDFMKAVRDAMGDQDRVCHFIERRGWTELAEVALRLGIGGDQLTRILRSLGNPWELRGDDQRRRAELVSHCVVGFDLEALGLRPRGGAPSEVPGFEALPKPSSTRASS